jgi:ABC-type sugar transport system ATPase subunit
VIRVRDLSVRVPGFALRCAGFEVPSGAVGVVTGPTGAGKTTLIESIAGVRRIAGGEILLDGIDVTAQPPDARNVGLVYQAGWLFPHLSVRNNVAYGARNAAVIADVTALLDLRAVLEKPVGTLSGGERQQVALARALAREPRTLLLDEPFAAMDSALRAHVRSTVLEWAAARGVTTLLVTHDAQEAALPQRVQLQVEGGVVRVVS